MSQEYYILNLLNIEDKNIKLIDNFYKIEEFGEIKYKVIESILSYEQAFCPKCGCVFNKDNTYEKNGFKKSDGCFISNQVKYAIALELKNKISEKDIGFHLILLNE